MIVSSRELRRGDMIISRRSAPRVTVKMLVLRSRWCDTHLSLDLMLFNPHQIITGCALPADDEFTIERSETDVIVEAMRIEFAKYCETHRL